MLPWEVIDRARAPDGTELILARRGTEWVVRAGGHVLMSSRVHGSEETLAALALDRARAQRTILLGGLGLGFTLRAVLDRLPPDARVITVELVHALADWNRGPLAELAGRPLEDPRVRLQMGDVSGRIAEADRAYDAILLDVDNGPSSLVHAANDRLYGDAGLHASFRALTAGGALAIWSSAPDPAFLRKLERVGFKAEARTAPARGSAGGVRHVIFLGVKPTAPRRTAHSPPRA